MPWFEEELLPWIHSYVNLLLAASPLLSLSITNMETPDESGYKALCWQHQKLSQKSTCSKNPPQGSCAQLPTFACRLEFTPMHSKEQPCGTQIDPTISPSLLKFCPSPIPPCSLPLLGRRPWKRRIFISKAKISRAVCWRHIGRRMVWTQKQRNY